MTHLLDDDFLPHGKFVITLFGALAQLERGIIIEHHNGRSKKC